MVFTDIDGSTNIAELPEIKIYELEANILGNIVIIFNRNHL
jgi:hypothetical protein